MANGKIIGYYYYYSGFLFNHFSPKFFIFKTKRVHCFTNVVRYSEKND